MIDMIDQSWIDKWLGAVASGDATMSQRSLSAIDRHGGLDATVVAARSLGVHLVRLVDDKGRDLVAASREPFETLC